MLTAENSTLERRTMTICEEAGEARALAGGIRRSRELPGSFCLERGTVPEIPPENPSLPTGTVTFLFTD
ncbi:MAG TPA: hypothetical protein VKH41_07720, partial [Myxococcota bacterium]|nr:hypothetical protein [Myxococcota bacterium]